MRLQITFDKKTHPQGLPVYQDPKLKTGKPLDFFERIGTYAAPGLQQPPGFDSITASTYEFNQFAVVCRHDGSDCYVWAAYALLRAYGLAHCLGGLFDGCRAYLY